MTRFIFFITNVLIFIAFWSGYIMLALLVLEPGMWKRFVKKFPLGRKASVKNVQ